MFLLCLQQLFLQHNLFTKYRLFLCEHTIYFQDYKHPNAERNKH